MDADRIKCACPTCRASFKVPPSAIGHKARCAACGVVFRVAERLNHPPTDDDILRWLREAEEVEDAMADATDDAADRPRRTEPAIPAAPDTDDEADESGEYGRVIPMPGRVPSRIEAPHGSAPQAKTA